MNKIVSAKVLAIVFYFLSVTLGLSTETDPNTVLAKINDKEIKLGHLIQAVTKLPAEYQNLEDEYLFRVLLDQMVKHEIMSQSLKKDLNFVKFGIENETRSLRAKEALENHMLGLPSEEQILESYEIAKKSMANTDEYNASHILVKTEVEAKELLNLLKTTDDFALIAKNNSTGPSGPNGGELGWFSTGQMVPEFEAAVIVLEIGKVSQPVETKFGWHIIKLNDRRKKEMPSLDNLRNNITQNLKISLAEEIIQKTASKYKIEILKTDIQVRDIRNTNLIKN